MGGVKWQCSVYCKLLFSWVCRLHRDGVTAIRLGILLTGAGRLCGSRSSVVRIHRSLISIASLRHAPDLSGRDMTNAVCDEEDNVVGSVTIEWLIWPLCSCNDSWWHVNVATNSHYYTMRIIEANSVKWKFYGFNIVKIDINVIVKLVLLAAVHK